MVKITRIKQNKEIIKKQYRGYKKIVRRLQGKDSWIVG